MVDGGGGDVETKFAHSRAKIVVDYSHNLKGTAAMFGLVAS